MALDVKVVSRSTGREVVLENANHIYAPFKKGRWAILYVTVERPGKLNIEKEVHMTDDDDIYIGGLLLSRERIEYKFEKSQFSISFEDPNNCEYWYCPEIGWLSFDYYSPRVVDGVKHLAI